jgi:hypothetical protein
MGLLEDLEEAYSKAQSAYEQRDICNESVFVSRENKVDAEFEFLHDEEITQMDLKAQRKMVKATKKEVKNLSRAEKAFRQADLEYVKWARRCDYLRQRIEAEKLSRGLV